MSSYLIYECILIPSIYCFLFTYIISFIIVIRSGDWFLVWIGLEINIISFLMIIYKRYRMIVGESCLKYFFIQRLGSSLFIGIFYLRGYLIGGIIILILSLKIGAGPFFFWFPSLCSGLDWISCFFIIFFQKVLPLILIFIFVHWILWFIAFVRLVVGMLGSFNQRNIKMLIAYSSIHHLGWILIVGCNRSIKWILYLVLYGIILYRVVVLLFSDDIIDLSSLFISEYKVIFIIGILRMGGVPPLLGFFLKWMALVNIINLRIIYLLILIMISVVILYIYIRVIYDIIILSKNEWGVGLIFPLYYYNIDNIRVIGIITGIIILFYFI